MCVPDVTQLVLAARLDLPARAGSGKLGGMDDHQHCDDMGLLPAIAVGTSFVFYLVWGAMHDIAHGEPDTTFEYAALIISIPAFAFLYRMALLHLASRAKLAWLGGTGLLVLMFDLASGVAILRPKYVPDPMLGSLFLMAGVPVLGLLSYTFFASLFAADSPELLNDVLRTCKKRRSRPRRRVLPMRGILGSGG